MAERSTSGVYEASRVSFALMLPQEAGSTRLPETMHARPTQDCRTVQIRELTPTVPDRISSSS
jgi:hypothetical protein